MSTRPRKTTPNSSRQLSNSAAAVVPRLSASLLLVNAKNEVLVIQRTKESSSFPGMHAFPGGNYDQLHDGALPPEEAMPITAIREAFEETGILLAYPQHSGSPVPNPVELSTARKAIHSRSDPYTFPDFLKQYHLSTENVKRKLIPFSQWITPANAKARFWTWFYVVFLDELEGNVYTCNELQETPLEKDLNTGSQEAVTKRGVEEAKRIPVAITPSHDGQIEVVSTYFQHPKALLDSFGRKEISLMPPQFYLLTMFSDILNIASTTGKNEGTGTTLIQRFRELAAPGFGGRNFNPRFGGKIKCSDGIIRSSLMYEGDQDYEKKVNAAVLDSNDLDPSQRRWHRSLVTFQDSRIATIRLERDIDVLEPGSGRQPVAKL
ncbi:hypothetical protein FRC18_009233 [Serendipita sp. 400]|nr:hypothetical protein FRC18_009233 [Serendipita sp. 400]